MTTLHSSAQDKITVQAAWISLAVSVVVLCLKFLAYRLTNSTAVLSDATESIVNVVAATMSLFVMRAVAAPADKEHPYGHGKLEFFSAAFEGGLIAFAAIAIGFESIRVLIEGKSLNTPDIGMWVMTAAAIINLGLGFYLRGIGRKHQSIALEASGRHVLSDVWTSAGVLVGLGVVWATGLTWLDPLVALIIAANLGYEGYKIVRGSIGGLIDEADQTSLADLAAAFQKHKEAWVIDIHQLRVIRSGKFHHVDTHLVVPEYWDVLKTHEKTIEFEKKVVATYPFDGEIAFHIDPCERKYCEICEMADCPVRVKPMIAVRRMSADTLIRGPQS